LSKTHTPLRSFIRLGMRPRALILPAVLAFVGGLAEAGQMMLLTPITSMVVDDYASVTRFELFSHSFAVPQSLLSMGQRYVFALLVGLIFALIAVKVGSELCCAVLTNNAAQDFLQRLRSNLFKRYLGFSKAFYDRLGVSRVYASLMSQTFELSSNLVLMRQLLSQFALTIGYAYVLISISWKLAALSVALYPIYKGLNSLINRRIISAAEHNVANVNRFADYVNTTLSCIPLIKGANGEVDAHRRFIGVATEVAATEKEIERRQQLLAASHEFVVPLIAVGMLVALRFSTVLHADSGGPRILVFFLAMRRCVQSTSAMFLLFARLSRLGPVCTLLEETMSEQPGFVVTEGREALPPIRKGIEVRKLSFGYDDTQVLRDVSLDIPRGSRVALVGPTGSGKSTVLSILLRLYDVPPGTIFIDGRDVRDFTLESVRDRIAVVSQDCYVLNDSLRNNLAHFARGTVDDERLWEVMRLADFEDRARKMDDGLETMLGDRGIALSGGERQRLAIARALLRDPEILLLDEATSALDRATESRVNEALARFCKGRTVVAVAHRLAAIAEYDQIMTLHGGAIIEKGTYDELMAKPDGFFRHSVQMQAAGLTIKAS
jgi:subfamily B ATP-binding cassette protein MsbA